MPDLRLVTEEPFTGALYFGRAPEGELRFEDSITSVESESVAETLVSTYKNLERAESASTAADEGDTDEGETAVKIPDPDDLTVDEVRRYLDDADPAESVLAELLVKEQTGKNRTTATEAIRGAMDDPPEA